MRASSALVRLVPWTVLNAFGVSKISHRGVPSHMRPSWPWRCAFAPARRCAGPALRDHCASFPQPPAAPKQLPLAEVPIFTQTGPASWYRPKHQKRTASGEAFDAKALDGRPSHPSLRHHHPRHLPEDRPDGRRSRQRPGSLLPWPDTRSVGLGGGAARHETGWRSDGADRRIRIGPGLEPSSVGSTSLVFIVVPATAGIQGHAFGILPVALDPRIRGDDGRELANFHHATGISRCPARPRTAPRNPAPPTNPS